MVTEDESRRLVIGEDPVQNTEVKRYVYVCV